MYDNNNIFAKIIRKEIPCDTLYEDDKVLFFHDINPIAKVHVLAIPKNPVINFREFVEKTDSTTVKYFFDKISEVTAQLGIDKSGYRLVTNDGPDSGQEVPHFHVHIIGGQNLGGLMAEK